MSSASNVRPPADPVLVKIAEYVLRGPPESTLAYETARHAIFDSMGCALLALNFPECVRRLGPIAPEIPCDGVAVPGTEWRLDPVQAAFNLGAMIRWLDFNDTWLALEWGHPSDNFAAILSAADYLSRVRGTTVIARQVLDAAIAAYEIQGVLAIENSFNKHGLDHVLLVRVASAAVTAKMLGGTKDQVLAAISNAWADGGALRVYRQAPNTGPRKSWAAGDASSRGLWHAFQALRGECAYPSVLTNPSWGFSRVCLFGEPLRLDQALEAYVMENILFKVSFPAEFHAQTAVEASLKLHPKLAGSLDEIQKIRIRTQRSAVRIIDKSGPLHNAADRDHCLQYMVAVPLIFGELTAEHYEDETAADPRIDALRSKMTVEEEPRYSKDYLDPAKRSIANSVAIEMRNGTVLGPAEVEYPIGHRSRRAEALPLLIEKFRRNLNGRLSAERIDDLVALWAEPDRFDGMAVPEFLDLFAPGQASS
ncbi:MAG: bifunctional 2-methylcitrate dehydratase/aconitate hydratase [Verrucomicrobiae bacterium]|nr:bifunctional 2-methylcitrate dehydratase/aconitate hydratase [Verrucomicrobiae bacterium]